MPGVTIQEISVEQQWCIELRRILRLKRKRFSLGTSDETKLRESDTLVREKLKALAGKDQAKFKVLGAKYKSLSENTTTLREGNEEAILVVTEELNVLGKQLEYEIALAECQGLTGKDREKAIKKKDKANEAFTEAKGKLDGKYLALIGQAARNVSEIGVLPFADVSTSFNSLKEIHEKWDAAYKEAKGKRDVMFDYAQSLAELGTCAGLATSARAEIKIDQDEATLQAEYKGRYESKVERLKRVRANILGRVGAEPDVTLCDVALRAGETGIKPAKSAHVQEPKYHTGFLAIKEHVKKTETLEKRALKSESSILSKLAKDPEISGKQGAAETALARLFVSGSELITAAEHGNFEKQINEGLTKCSKDKAKGVKQLENLTTAFGGIYSERNADRTECNRLLPLVRADLDTLAYHPTDELRGELNDWTGELRASETDIGNCDFATARESLTELQGETSSAVGTCTTKKTDYETIWNDRKHEQLRADILAKARESVGPGVRLEDTFFHKNLERAKRRAGAGDFPGAIELIEMVAHNLARDQQVKDFTASQEFQDAERDVQAQLGKTRTALQTLRSALETAGDTKGIALKEQTAKVTEIETRWNQFKGAATDAADLGAKNYIDELAALVAEFIKMAANPKALRGALIQAQLHIDAKAFDDATKLVNAALDELAKHDRGPRYEALVKERTKLESEAPAKTGGYTASIEAMTLLKGKVETQTRTALGEHTTALANFNRKATEVQTEINDLRRAATTTLKPKNQKFFEPYFLDVEADFAALADIRKSTSLAMLNQGSLELDRLLKRIRQIQTDMSGNVGSLKELVGNALGRNDAPEEELDPEDMGLVALFSEDEQGQPKLSESVTPTFQLVVAALADIGEQLKDENLATCKPTRKRLLDEDYKGLSSDVKGLAPADGLKALFNFQKRVTEAVELAEAAQIQRDDFNTTHKPAAKLAFKKLTGYEPESKLGKVGKDVKAYYEELAREYTAAKALIEDENKEPEALTKIKELKTKLEKASGTPGDLDKNEREAQNRKLQAEKDKLQWEMYAEEFERRTLPRVAEALNVDGADKTQYKDCENLLKKAKDNFKSTQNAATALAMLTLARDRAEVAIQFPLGTAATSRNQLPKSAARWKKAVASFNASIDKVIDAIDAAAEGMNVKGALPGEDEDFGLRELLGEAEDVEQAARQAALVLRSLKRLFDPNLFDKAVAVMSAKKVEPRAARAAREEGLREVRRYFDMLYKDSMLVKLMQNPRPFGIVEESAVYTALRDLDLNLQRSV